MAEDEVQEPPKLWREELKRAWRELRGVEMSPLRAGLVERHAIVGERVDVVVVGVAALRGQREHVDRCLEMPALRWAARLEKLQGPLVGPVGGHHVAVAHLVADALRELDERPVAGEVTVGVVERLEPVDVDHGQGEGADDQQDRREQTA